MLARPDTVKICARRWGFASPIPARSERRGELFQLFWRSRRMEPAGAMTPGVGTNSFETSARSSTEATVLPKTQSVAGPAVGPNHDQVVALRASDPREPNAPAAGRVGCSVLMYPPRWQVMPRAVQTGGQSLPAARYGRGGEFLPWCRRSIDAGRLARKPSNRNASASSGARRGRGVVGNGRNARS